MSHFTNETGDVFALKDLGIIGGAALARYSRSKNGIRDILRSEFMAGGQLSVDAADELVERVLIAFGDDSVGELEGGHLCLENLSMLATKLIEHRRIGLSPIEKSSRYVRYDLKVDGEYQYFVPDLPERERSMYRTQMNYIFDRYTELSKIVRRHLRQKKPIAEASYVLDGVRLTLDDVENTDREKAFRQTYRNDLRTKSCDIARAFLPLATKTNVGIYGNGRAYQHLITILKSCDLKEGRNLGDASKSELSKIMPHYVRRADIDPYRIENRNRMRDIARKYFDSEPVDGPEVTLCSKVFDDRIELAAHCIYPFTNLSFVPLIIFLSANPSIVEEIIRAYMGDRRTRRDRPERGFEAGYPYNFELVTEWAVYKDLMRHRMSTIQIQNLTTNIGFEMPPEIVEIGQEAINIAQSIIRVSETLKMALEGLYPAESEYSVLHGHKVRWMISLNLRALTHLIELRSTIQGHPNYRRVAQKMHTELGKRDKLLADTISFVNYDEVYWSRADSESRQRDKEKQWEQSHT